MEELVFCNPKRIEDEPFTTSEAIAQCAGVTRHAVQQLCVKYQSDLEEFGQVAFEMRAVKTAGGRGVKRQKVYHLNEQQATLLITYLQNTPQVRAFKKELVRQFFLMRDKLANVASARNDFRTLTDHIALIKEEPKFYHFSNECDLINRLATGMSAKAFREAHGIGKGESIRPYLTSEQAKTLDDLQRVDIGLLVAVPDFKERKAALTAYRDRRAALTSPTGGNRAAYAK